MATVSIEKTIREEGADTMSHTEKEPIDSLHLNELPFDPSTDLIDAAPTLLARARGYFESLHKEERAEKLSEPQTLAQLYIESGIPMSQEQLQSLADTLNTFARHSFEERFNAAMLEMIQAEVKRLLPVIRKELPNFSEEQLIAIGQNLAENDHDSADTQVSGNIVMSSSENSGKEFNFPTFLEALPRATAALIIALLSVLSGPRDAKADIQSPRTVSIVDSENEVLPTATVKPPASPTSPATPRPTPIHTPVPGATATPTTSGVKIAEASDASVLPTVTPEPKPPVIEQAQEVRVVYVPTTVNMRASTSTESAKVFADAGNTERIFKIVKDITVGTYTWYELESVNKAGDTAYVRSDVATDVRTEKLMVAGPNTGGVAETVASEPLAAETSSELAPEEGQVVISSPEQLSTIPATAESLSFAEGTNPDVAAIARILEKLGFSSEFSISVQESSVEHPIKYIYGFQTDIPEAQKLLEDNTLSPQSSELLTTFIEKFLTERGVDLSEIKNMAVLSIHELSEQILSNFYVQTTTTENGSKTRSPLTNVISEEFNSSFTDFGMVISQFTDINNNPYNVVTVTIYDKQSGSILILTFDPVAGSSEDRAAELADKKILLTRMLVASTLAVSDSSFKLADGSNEGPSLSAVSKNDALYNKISAELQLFFDAALLQPLIPR